jgi:hypothetical protein
MFMMLSFREIERVQLLQNTPALMGLSSAILNMFRKGRLERKRPRLQ